jgi:hypothetical protein
VLVACDVAVRGRLAGDADVCHDVMLRAWVHDEP